MKKRNLKSLNLNKTSISTLMSSVGGGRTFTVTIGTGCVTVQSESCSPGDCLKEPTYT